MNAAFNPKHPVLNEVSLTLYPGARVGLSGPSGSGKSMLALAIAGLLPSSAVWSAKHLVWSTSDGRDIDLLSASASALQEYRRNEIAVIWQDPYTALNPTSTVGDQLAEALRVAAVGDSPSVRTQLTAELAKVRLNDEPDRILKAYPHELSGGQLQRVVIAMALLGKPRLLIADEPTTALDPATEVDILALIHRLVTEREMALLLITHDRRVLKANTETILEVHNGKLRTVAVVAPHNLNQVNTGKRLINDDIAQPAVTVSKLEFRYETAPLLPWRRSTTTDVLRGINLRIQVGEWVALLGESGSGKTTLARCLTSALIPTSGEIDYSGGSAQVIPQNPGQSLNPRHKIATIISEVLRANKGSWAGLPPAPTELLEKVGLEASTIAGRYPAELSGGQRQRVVIARALAANPSLLIADESVSALDEDLRDEIIKVYQRLLAGGRVGLLFITHDPRLARSYADRVIRLAEGQLSEEYIG